ncbi:MAG: hypothetical protein C0592_11075 [Marinilabiliales bacterium]|nr:MAG: hypothetical protein C0592_11075 [Marinilabiliales bacterium]
MKYLSVFLLFIYISIISTAQTKVDINEAWIEIIPADTSAGIFDNTYVFNNAPNGYFEIYSNSEYEDLLMEGAFHNEKMQGQWLFYNNNVLSEEVVYLNDYRNGFYKCYYPSGQLKILAYYKNGLAEGDYFIYNEDGSIRTKYKMHNGEIIE